MRILYWVFSSQLHATVYTLLRLLLERLEGHETMFLSKTRKRFHLKKNFV